MCRVCAGYSMPEPLLSVEEIEMLLKGLIDPTKEVIAATTPSDNWWEELDIPVNWNA